MRQVFKDIRTIMEAGGAAAGSLELIKISYEKPVEHAKSKGIERFENLNSLCEGFFMIEHILLRPLLSTDYSVSFFDVLNTKQL